MNEIAGAIERPQDSHILIVESPESFEISIPPPRIPIVMKIVVFLGVLGVVAFFLIGLQFLVFHHSIVLDHNITEGEFRAMPPFEMGFYTFGWLMMTALSAYMVVTAARPMTRRERISLSRATTAFQTSLFGNQSETVVATGQIRNFHNRRDPTAMQESRLVARLVLSNDSEGEEEIELAVGTSEAEKQWLASVLNLLLTRCHQFT